MFVILLFFINVPFFVQNEHQYTSIKPRITLICISIGLENILICVSIRPGSILICISIRPGSILICISIRGLS